MEERETARPVEATFLLDVIGRGLDRDGNPNFIAMCDADPWPGAPRDRKYTTVRRHPTLADCAGHLAGRYTVGGYLTHGARAELARAICYDADDPAGYARIEAAAWQLRTAGARPLLEQTPLPEDAEHAGGGKLWLVFPIPVRWSDAQATAECHASGLRGLEHFPPGRVRLPGGLYRRGLNVWSELCAPGAADPNWYTGALAIRTMIEQETPIAWVTIPSWHPHTVGKELPAGQEEPIPLHARNRTLTSLAGTMRRRGMSAAAIAAALLADNEARCTPPLPVDEVARIARSVSRYPPAPYRPRVRVTAVDPRA